MSARPPVDSAPTRASARVRARVSPPVAFAGGDGSTTVMSILTAEHTHGRGILGFLRNMDARKSLARVCRELCREVYGFAWAVVDMKGHTDAVRNACVLADGRVVSASADKTLRVWCATSGVCERVLVGHTGAVRDVCAIAGGRVVSTSADNTNARVERCDGSLALHSTRRPLLESTNC